MKKTIIMSNESLLPPEPCRERVLPLDLPPEAAFVHRNTNGVLPADYGPVTLSAHCTFDGDFCSQDFMVVGDAATNRYVFAGALTADRSLTHLTLERRQGRFTCLRIRQPHILPNQPGEEIWVAEGSDWRELIKEYADRVARQAGIGPISARENLTGWCSWYYHYEEFHSGHLEEILPQLQAGGDTYPCRVVQIDDAYQAHHGDWLELRDSWHIPLGEVAERIRAIGAIPGIWLMPFLATTTSRVFHEHRDWFVRDGQDEPYVIKGWSAPPDHHWVCLDASRQDVRDHLADLFRTLREMGFAYFKLDGTGMSQPEGRRVDPDATPLSAYRLGMQAIRHAVPDAFLLGCGAPFLATLGLADSVRVSPDTAPKWEAYGQPEGAHNEPCHFGMPCLRNALHYSLAKWWMADRWYRIDPDCLITRDERTSLSEGEARISALTGIVTGIAITSDHPGKMGRDRLELLGRAARLRLRNPIPLDAIPGSWPQAYAGTVEGRPAVALFNDSEEPRTFHPGELGLNGEAEELLHPLGKMSGPFQLARHDAALLVQTRPPLA